MLPAHFDGPDRGAQIYGTQSILDPPDRSAFNPGGGGGGGGCPESVIRLVHIWTIQERARKSMVQIGFWTPSSVLPLTEGGGGSGMSYKRRAKICGQETGA
jgi:hypothetical protein